LTNNIAYLVAGYMAYFPDLSTSRMYHDVMLNNCWIQTCMLYFVGCIYYGCLWHAFISGFVCWL